MADSQEKTFQKDILAALAGESLAKITVSQARVPQRRLFQVAVPMDGRNGHWLAKNKTTATGKTSWSTPKRPRLNRNKE